MSKSLKFGIILLAGLCVALLVLTLFGLPLESGQAETSEPAEETLSVLVNDEDLIMAVEKALETASGRWETFDYQIDHIQVQDDGQVALVWLVAIEPETGQILGREPELALAEKGVDGAWQVYLEDGEPFDEKFKGFQYAEKSLIGDDLDESQVQPKASRVFGGYYLPWAANLEKRLTWSVGHTSCSPVESCTHAFDFADGTMFPMVAAKGGTVYHWKDTCANGDPYCTNSITLQDRSTTPWTYQIYLHIANGSVPDNLKKVGTPVLQGQYIADVDDTGYSSGHHVHFMVVTEDTRYLSWRGYIWGWAEDITFKDVDINWDPVTQGGRPRLKYEADFYGGEGRSYYVSGNKPAHPPTGGLTKPATKTYVTNPLMSVTGWGEDDIAVTKYEILAKYAANWVSIHEVAGGNSFSTTVNLCNTNISDGPFKLALRVWDYEGNPSGILSARKLIKNVECGTAGSDPAASLDLNGGVLALPQNGFISASVTEGSGGSDIASVSFWLHGMSWSKDNWVYLGKDTNGTNGWQAPVLSSGLAEGGTYTVVAVAEDIAGKQGADANFKVIVDHTPPTVITDPVSSPFMEDVVNFTWSSSDNLAGVDYYELGIYMNSGPYQMLQTLVPRSTNSYQWDVAPEQIMIFEVKAYDKAGNVGKGLISVYTDGYVFPYSYILPSFFNGD